VDIILHMAGKVNIALVELVSTFGLFLIRRLDGRVACAVVLLGREPTVADRFELALVVGLIGGDLVDVAF